MMSQEIEYISQPDSRAILGQLEKSIRQEQTGEIAKLHSELGQVKSQLTKAQKQLEKCSTYLEVSKKVDRRQSKILDIQIDDPEIVKLVETFSEQFQQDVDKFVCFLITTLFRSDKGQQALAFLMSQFNN